jgi:hypothetical protein
MAHLVEGSVRKSGDAVRIAARLTLKEGLPPLKIPNPHSRDISVDLLKKILKQGNISRSEWLAGG